MTGRRRALVTGACGQDGILLSSLLLEQGYDVWGLARSASPRLDLLRRHAPGVHEVFGDIRDTSLLSQLLEDVRPHEVYNLAAFSSVGRSWSAAAEVMETNALAVIGLLDAIRAYRDDGGDDVRFYQASSSEMFGAPASTPQDERTTFHPRSPYGVSKVAAHYLALNYRESYGMFTCSGILYNHESPLREPHFVTRKITTGVAAIARGELSHLDLGNIDVSRDWGYAPDFVRAMWLMMQCDDPADYVIATGVSHTLSDFLAAAFSCIGIDNWQPYVRHDESLTRPAEVVGLVGDSTKAREAFGWAPTKPFVEIVADMVEHDLKQA